MPKLKLLVEKLTQGPVPDPRKVAVCGLLEALSVMVSVPLSVPVAVGENVTLIVHELLAATLPAQLLV